MADRKPPKPHFSDDGPTRPDGAPSAPLDVSSHSAGNTISDARGATLEAEQGTPTERMRVPPQGIPGVAKRRARGVELDALVSVFEIGLRAWGRMTATGAPRNIEEAIVSGCTRLGTHLRAIDRPSTDEDDQAIAAVAVKVRLAVEKFEQWVATQGKR